MLAPIYIFREEERVSPGHTRGVCVCVQVVCVGEGNSEGLVRVTYHITRGEIWRWLSVVMMG